MSKGTTSVVPISVFLSYGAGFSPRHNLYEKASSKEMPAMTNEERMMEVAKLRLRFRMNNRLRLESLAMLSRLFREHNEPIADELLASIVFAVPEELMGEAEGAPGSEIKNFVQNPPHHPLPRDVNAPTPPKNPPPHPHETTPPPPPKNPPPHPPARPRPQTNPPSHPPMMNKKNKIRPPTHP